MSLANFATGIGWEGVGKREFPVEEGRAILSPLENRGFPKYPCPAANLSEVIAHETRRLFTRTTLGRHTH